MTTEEIAQRLVELCRAGKYDEAQVELYADGAVSLEPAGLPPGALGNASGLEAIREKGRRFEASLEAVHSSTVSDPVVGGNWFSVAMNMDVTMKRVGRIDMREICVYRVAGGKITHEQFFYDVG